MTLAAILVMAVIVGLGSTVVINEGVMHPGFRTDAEMNQVCDDMPSIDTKYCLKHRMQSTRMNPENF